VSGFLVRKTIQPYSLRKNHSNFEDFKNTNLVTYINKRFGEQRNNVLLFSTLDSQQQNPDEAAEPTESSDQAGSESYRDPAQSPHIQDSALSDEDD
jgi:hypothetical protein